MGKIIHGNKSFGFAPITVTGNSYSFGTPVMIPGLVEASIEVEQEDTNIYADNKVYCRVKGAKVRTATVTFRNIPAAYAPYLGFVANDNGSFTDTGAFANHCIFFETEEEDCETGLSTTTLHYLYNAQASEPTWESATDEDEVEAAEIEVEYSVTDSPFVVDDEGKAVQYMYLTRDDTTKTLYDTFQTTVILPNS